MKLSQIWNVLNEAVMGTRPVYEIAQSMEGLPSDVIMDIATKMRDDLHYNPKQIIETKQQEAKSRKFRKFLQETQK